MNTSILRNDLVKMKHQRVRYFAGQFLEDKDFEIEQQYHLLRRRRLNKQQFTAGVREGFIVEAVGAILRIGTGFAIDAEGRELWLDEVHVLTAEQVGNGNYFLYMQATEIVEGYTTYALPEDAARGKDIPSSWAGNTRYTDAIRFSLVSADEPGEVHSVRIRLASLKCADGKFDTVNSNGRTVSTTSLGGGLTINASNGKQNAYIRVDNTLTFSSMSKRMDFTGEAPLYMFNRGGVVIAHEQFPGAPDAGRLHVQGKAHLQGGASVSQGVKELGTLEVLAINGTTLKSTEGTFGVTIDSNEGKLLLEGKKTLRISNKEGVVIAKNNEGAGDGKPGSLRVEGALTVAEELIVPGAKFTSHGGAMKLESTMADKTNKHRMHISGDWLFLLQKKKVVIGKFPKSEDYPWESSGDLEVHGESTFKDLVVHSPGIRSNHLPNKDLMAKKLEKSGAFLFFVEPDHEQGEGAGDGKLIVYWKSGEKMRACILHNNTNIFPN